LQKRSTVFNSVPASRRLIVETGSLVESDHEQDLMKFRIFFEALRLLHYDVVHLTGQDHEIATRLGLLADQRAFDIVDNASDQPAAFTKRFVAQGRDVTIRVASIRNRGPEAAGASTVDILILEHCDPNALKTIEQQWPGVQCIVCPSSSDEPQLLSKPGDVPLVCTVGRFGRYVCRLGVTIQERTARPVVRFESIPLQAGLPDDPALVELYRQYQQLVAQSSLLESYPRVPLPQKLAFAGSAICKQCHESAYDKWSTTAHAHALAALKKVGSDRDPECVICHVIGLGYEGGFVNEEKTPHLAGVGCENCHGPGSEHVLAFGQTAPGQPKTACTQCHTPEQSGGFAGHEEEYMKKILHWREPAAAGNVKN
jgi:hypothetical protein